MGDSEHNLQAALEVVDSAHPCVLWIDEIEKAFAGTNNVSGDSDSVMMRLMGKFLSWMQERKTAVFIMATANDVLKPELMRKGRFDEVYFVDFPTAEEAKEIINNTLKKYSDLVIDNGPLNIFSNEGYISKIAKDMTTSCVCAECKKCKEYGECVSKGVIDPRRCLSGAEITSVIDSFVSNEISKLIENTKGESSVDLMKLLTSQADFDEHLKTAIKSAMINQKSLRCPKREKSESQQERKRSFIDKIYDFRDNYNFQSASTEKKEEQN